ncbi:MAG: Jag N-terminal domain-containing protein [Actinomycetia bacterium]|nr:Jag N-terminal domain-containing protein [Actinomycetes bacterium]
MEKEFTATAETIEAALDEALEQLGVQQDAVTYEILEEPSTSFFSGNRPAVVKVTVRADYIQELRSEKDIDEEGDGFSESGESPAPDLRRDYEDLSDEEIDAIADEATKVLKEMVNYFEIDAVSIDEYEGDEGEIIFDITGEKNLALLIGRHGRTIDALQVLMSSITTKRCGIHYPLSVDVEGYRHRRKQKITEIATRAGERCVRSHRPVPLKPMTPYERRLVHIALRDMKGVTSESEGAGAQRHVVVFPS